MPFKTLGSQSARLVTTLYKENRPVFRVGDIQRTLATKEATARDLAKKLVALAVASRLDGGKLVEYALRMDIGAVIRRRGYIMERLPIRHGGCNRKHSGGQPPMRRANICCRFFSVISFNIMIKNIFHCAR